MARSSESKDRDARMNRTFSPASLKLTEEQQAKLSSPPSEPPNHDELLEAARDMGATNLEMLRYFRSRSRLLFIIIVVVLVGGELRAELRDRALRASADQMKADVLAAVRANGNSIADAMAVTSRSTAIQAKASNPAVPFDEKLAAELREVQVEAVEAQAAVLEQKVILAPTPAAKHVAEKRAMTVRKKARKLRKEL